MSEDAKFDSLTGIVVPTSTPSVELLEALSMELSRLSHDGEIVVVSNGARTADSQVLCDLVERVPDTTVHFLAEAVDQEVATLVGMDRALGDWVIVLTPTAQEIGALERLLRETRHFEVVFGVGRERPQPPSLYSAAGEYFFRIYKKLSGAKIEWPTPPIRIYSREATRYLISRLDGEFLMKVLTPRGAFPGTLVALPELDSGARTRPLGEAVRKALRSLFAASTVPLRLAVSLACVGFVLGLVAIGYAIFIYLTLKDVQPGWTTLSILMAGMLVIFSGLFSLLTLYLLAIYSSIQPRSRMPVVRELRSSKRRHADRLNVIDGSDSCQLGAPSERVPNVRP
jgi:hypothetical protein